MPHRSGRDRTAAALARLPSTFTYTQARSAGLNHRTLYGLRDAGAVEVVSRGLYRRTDAEPADLTLVEAVTRAPWATLCLTSALVHHGLSDAIPFAPHLALPRGTRPPALAGAVTWHAFDPARFEIGRDTLVLDSTLSLAIYGPERTIVDTFRMRHRQGDDEAYEALRRWVRRRGTQPADLLRMARHFPRTVGPIRRALEILL